MEDPKWDIPYGIPQSSWLQCNLWGLAAFAARPMGPWAHGLKSDVLPDEFSPGREDGHLLLDSEKSHIYKSIFCWLLVGDEDNPRKSPFVIFRSRF